MPNRELPTNYFFTIYREFIVVGMDLFSEGRQQFRRILT